MNHIKTNFEVSGSLEEWFTWVGMCHFSGDCVELFDRSRNGRTQNEVIEDDDVRDLEVKSEMD
jgi:hypothetical protein